MRERQQVSGCAAGRGFAARERVRGDSERRGTPTGLHPARGLLLAIAVSLPLWLGLVGLLLWILR